MVQQMKFRKHLKPAQADKLAKTFLGDDSYDTLITSDTNGYDLNGRLLFKFRKGALPLEVVQSGYEAFKDSISLTDGRGNAAGGNSKRIRKDGTVSNISVANKVESGNVGFMDASAMVKYCRKTAFARQYFDKFQEGIPFVKAVNGLYAQLCPEHYAKQIAIAKGTNRNYVIADTAFTTVTVNRNFQTAVHKDSGDLPDGFGNLCVYRTGEWTGSYFCLPEYRVAIDMQNTDMLFVDVHTWHGNTPFHNLNPEAGDMRIAFVMYYREYMMKCDSPSKELEKIQQEKNGFFTL